MSGPKAGYPAPKIKTPGASWLVGSFETDDTAAPINVKGAGFTIGAPTAGVYTVTITDGWCKYAIPTGIGIEDATADANDTVRYGDLDAVSTAGTFTIITASAAGTDANLNGPRVWFAILLFNTNLTK